MKIGTARLGLTPSFPVELSGYIGRVQPCVGRREPLCARALYAESDGRRLLWLHADVLGFDHAFVRETKAAVARRTGVPETCIVLTASHSHASPTLVELGPGCGAMSGEFRQHAAEKLLDAAAEAVANPEAATLLAAEGASDLGRDRRGKPSAHRDPRLPVLAWAREDGSYAAVLCSYAVHNVGYNPDNRRLDAEITGHAAARLERELPGAPVALFAIGAAGNINPPGWTADPAQVAAWGDQLAEAAFAALGRAAPDTDRVACAGESVPFAWDVFTTEEVGHTADRMIREAASHPPHLVEPVRNAARAWRERIQERRRAGALAGEGRSELTAVRLGGTVLALFDWEVFSRMGDLLRATLGPRAYPVGYANGLWGYLPTSAAYDEGGYEVNDCFVYFRNLRPKAGTFEQLGARMATLAGRIA